MDTYSEALILLNQAFHWLLTAANCVLTLHKGGALTVGSCLNSNSANC